MILINQRIKIIENIIDSLDDEHNAAEYIDDPRNFTESYDQEVLDEITNFLGPVKEIWEKNENEVREKYRDVEIKDYVEKFTFDTKDVLKNLYLTIRKNYADEYIDSELDDQFIYGQIHHEFGKKMKDYILELKTPEALAELQSMEELKIEKQMEYILEEFKKVESKFLEKYKKMADELKTLREQNNKKIQEIEGETEPEIPYFAGFCF
tara:strand:- start:893 stop:1519 length:627 start_codon:yes stop_codon:yes gene_type:complete